MLDQLFQLIQQSGQQAVVENPEVPNQNNDAILNEAQQYIANGLQGLAQTGELNNLTAMADNPMQLSAAPAVQNISNNFAGSIMEKFGINKGMASMIAASIIPMVLGKLLKGNTGGQQGSGFDLGGLVSSLTGGNAGANQNTTGSGGIMDTISSIGSKIGLDKDGDGDVDLNDLMGMFKK